jgi:hypothetical protein
VSEQVKTTYGGVEIGYDEDRDKWVFELNGRERSAETLLNAKKAIDAKPPAKGKDAFKRFEAYKAEGYRSSRYSVVTVTSIAEATSRYNRGEIECWILDKKDRSKVAAARLYKINEANDVRIATLKRLEEQASQIRQEMSDVEDQLEVIDLPKDEGTEE